MSDFLPIEIRHLDQTVEPLLSSNLFPVVIGNIDNGFETRSTTIKEIFDFINLTNQDSFIETLNVNNSAVIQNYLNVGQIFGNTGYKLYVDGDVLIGGALSALSGVSFFNTDVITTSSMYLTGASGVVLRVEQPFDFPIAQFYDGDSITGDISLHIDGEDIRAGNVGIKTITPNEALTVFGNISSSGIIYSPNLITNTISSNNLETNSIFSKDSVYLGTNDYSLINLGNSSSNIDINGNLTINTIYSGVSTIIGNPESEVFINGYLFTKDISSSGNIYINSNETDAFNISIGNLNSINIIQGTNLISATNFIDGETNINSVDSYNTYINAGENTGIVYLGNNQNKTEINSNIFSVNTILTSDFIYLNFTDYDSLTSTIDDVFSTTTVVASSLIENTLNPEITSFQYQILQKIEGQNINLSEEVINLGNTDFLINIRGSTINIDPDSVINISTLSGGNINLGGEQTSTKIEGAIVQINNESNGITKDTYINNEEFSGNLYLGNISNNTDLNGLLTNINTLCSAETNIGNLSGSVNIFNLNIKGSLSADIESFDVSNINVKNLTVEESTLLKNNIFMNGTVECSGNCSFINDVFFNNNIKTGGSFYQSVIDLDGSQIIKTTSNIDALKITQTGTGNLLLAENSTTPFIITSSVNVGIGELNPSEKLTVFGSISSSETVYCNSIDLSSVKFTNEFTTATTNVSSTNQFIKVIVDNKTKYLRLFDID